MELRWHSNDHVIVVRVEITTFRHIKTERWLVMISGQQVIRIVSETRLMGACS